MNDLIPTSDFAVISLVPIILASAVFIAGGFFATRLKGFIGAGGILKKANAPEASIPPTGPQDSAEALDEGEPAPGVDDAREEDNNEPPEIAPEARQEPATGGLLERISSLRKRRGNTAASMESPSADDTATEQNAPKSEQPVTAPAPKKTKNSVQAEFIIARKDEDIKLAIRDGKMTVIDPRKPPDTLVRKIIYLNPEGGDIQKHSRPVTRYQAKINHNNLPRNIRIQGNISVSVAETVINRFPEKTQLYPLSLMALYWVDKQFKKPRAKKMVILTFIDMANPITYVLREDEETQQIVEEFLPGRQPNIQRKGINDDEIYRIDIIFDGVAPREHFDFSNNYKAPEASHVAELYLNQFINNVRVRPLTPPSDVDLKRYIAGTLGCGLVYGGIFLGNNFVKTEETRLINTIAELKQTQEDFDNKILDLWGKRLPQYLDNNKIDFVPLVKTLEEIGKINLFTLKDVLWERGGNPKKFVITGSFSMRVGENFVKQIEGKFAALTHCETEYKYDGGSNETSVISTCNM